MYANESAYQCRCSPVHRLQQRKVTVKRMEHLVTIENGLDRALDILRQVKQLTTQITRETAELKKLAEKGVDDKCAIALFMSSFDVELLLRRMSNESDIDERLAYRARVVRYNRRLQVCCNNVSAVRILLYL